MKKVRKEMQSKDERVNSYRRLLARLMLRDFETKKSEKSEKKRRN